MKFKEERLQQEYQELQSKNPKLYSLANLIDQFSQMELGKECVITEIYRSQDEQDSLYAETPELDRPKLSPHQIWQAFDLRSTIYTDQEIQRILKFANCFTYAGGQRQVAKYHCIAGNVYHFHVQYS